MVLRRKPVTLKKEAEQTADRARMLKNKLRRKIMQKKMQIRSNRALFKRRLRERFP